MKFLVNLFQQLFETGKDGVYACFKCQPLVPEVTIDDTPEAVDPQSQSSANDEVSVHLFD